MEKIHALLEKIRKSVASGAVKRIPNWVDEIADRQEVPPRVRVETRRSAKSVLFDSCDHGFDDAVLHRNLVTN